VVWASRPGRVRTLKSLVRRMLVIFEFEEEIYRRAGVDVAFVGHPLLDVLSDPPDASALRREWNIGRDETLIGLLPGSRSRQFRALFPRMRAAAERISRDVPGTRFLVACAPGISPRFANGPLPAVRDRTYDVMAASDLLLTASGTATIEAAILGTPMIVTYVVNLLTALALGPLIRVRDYAMVNIVAGRRVMPELYQFKAKPELLAREAISILRENRLAEMKRCLAEVRGKLGKPGASRRAAEEILRAL